MDYHRANRNLANEKEQLDYVQVVLKELQRVDSLLEQDRYLTQLSTEFNLSRETLQQQLKQNRQEQQPRQDAPPPAPTTNNPMVFTPPNAAAAQNTGRKSTRIIIVPFVS